MSERIQQHIERLKQARELLLDRLARIGERAEERIYSDGAQWTLRQLAIHLMISDKGHLAMVQGIASGNEIIKPDYDIERFNQRSVEKNAAVTVEEALQSLRDTHAALVAWLGTIEDSVLDKEGLHASLQVMTIDRILKVIAWHDGTHGEDIEKHLATPSA
jgi:uncharacterized damage-inducible protein DinB